MEEVGKIHQGCKLVESSEAAGWLCVGVDFDFG